MHIFSIFKPYVSIEPAFVLFQLAHGVADLIDVNLYLQKGCRNISKSEPDVRTNCTNEAAGIDLVAWVNSTFMYPGWTFTVIFVVLMSAWCDKSAGRRKFYILFPMVIKFGQLIGACLQSYYWDWPVIISIISNCSFIGLLAMRIATSIYICSISPPKDRTNRLLILLVLSTIATIISNGCSGYLLQNCGFLYTYALCTLLTLIAILHAALFVESTSSTDGTANWLQCIRDFFDVRSVIQAFKLVYRKRQGNEGIIVAILSMINVLSYVAFHGENTVLYIYLRHVFHWNEVDYSYYVFYKLVGMGIGSIICIGINKFFKISDAVLGIFAAFLDVVASLCYFFAAVNWQLYLIPLLDVFHGFALNVCDSMQSKFFKSHEMGRLFSVHMALDIVVPFCFPAYNLLFRSTMNFFPQSIFLLSSSVNLIVFVLYGICCMLMRTLPKAE